jgi:hypothetical protein
MFVVCLLRVMRGALCARWSILRVLAHSASTTPSEPGVMPAGELPLCLVLFLLLLCACVLQSPVLIRVQRMCLLLARVGTRCVLGLLQAREGTLRVVCSLIRGATQCVVCLRVMGARPCVVGLLLARGGTLCAVCQSVLRVTLCVLCLCVLGA